MPNQGVPVIFKNKIAYGYAEKSVQAYDVSVSDYNALTEQQQLDGSIRFIQGVDAIPNGSNVWAKLGTTPLAEGLPRDCSQAVNQLKSNLTEYEDYSETEVICGKWIDGKTIYKKTIKTATDEVSAGANVQINLSSLNIDKIIHFEGVVISGYSRVIPYSYRSTASYSAQPAEVLAVYYNGSSKVLFITNSSNQNLGTGYVTIKYTKAS